MLQILRRRAEAKLRPHTVLVDYWKIYGGFSALIRSPYIYIAAGVTVAVPSLWLPQEDANGLEAPAWTEFASNIIPSLMAFSLGGLAILLAFSNQNLIDAIQEDGEEKSLFMKAVSNFLHFIFIQTAALITMLLAVGMPSTIISAAGFFFMTYGILGAASAGSNLFRISRIFNIAGHSDDEDRE